MENGTPDRAREVRLCPPFDHQLSGQNWVLPLGITITANGEQVAVAIGGQLNFSPQQPLPRASHKQSEGVQVVVARRWWQAQAKLAGIPNAGGLISLPLGGEACTIFIFSTD